jgi:hypothetical protein
LLQDVACQIGYLHVPNMELIGPIRAEILQHHAIVLELLNAIAAVCNLQSGSAVCAEQASAH